MTLDTPTKAPFTGANPGRARAHNKRLVLGQVQAAGAMGRAAIARASGLSIQAVSNIIAELARDGLLVETGRLAQGRGLPVAQYELNADGGYALGIELRPDIVLGALLDLSGHPRLTRRLEVDRATPGRVHGLVAGLAGEARALAGERLLGAGIVMPGPFGGTGLDGPADLPGWARTDPAELLAAATGLDVRVENDANAAAMAERLTGAAQGLTDFAYLYFGTGLGLGIVSGGRLVTGARGNAGEIGQLPVAAAGGTVALETVASRLALQTALAAAGSPARDVDAIARLHEGGHPAVAAWLSAAAPALTQALGVIENLLDPQTVLIGGAMPRALLQDLTARIRPPAASVAARAGRDRPRLALGACGSLTATLGAATLVLADAFTPAIAD